MSLTQRLIPEALSFSQACLYTTRSPLLIPLYPPLRLFLSRLLLIYVSPCLPGLLCLPSPQSHSLPASITHPHHTREYTETPIQPVRACTEIAALSAAASVRSAINFLISGIPPLPLLLEFLPWMWKVPPTSTTDGTCVCCHWHAFTS